MSIERVNLISREHHQNVNIPLIALEGVGGSGKSHVGKKLDNLFKDSGLQVFTAKVSGLGDSERVEGLKVINNYRERLLQDGIASEKIIEDKRKDKIFRLATRHQIHLLLEKLKNTSADIGILDRTPIMPWVYASASDSNNPYLSEILKDGIEQTHSLNISTIYYLNVAPETAYSRIISRSCISDIDPEQRAKKLCDQIGANPESTQRIINGALNLISSNPELNPKDYRGWDFIPYQIMENECEWYVKALNILSQQHEVRYVIIDAQMSIQEVVTSIVADIKANNILQNL